MKTLHLVNNKRSFRTFVLICCTCFLIACASIVLFMPNIALAEEKSGIQFVLPDMVEFIPMLIAFLIIATLLGKFG